MPPTQQYLEDISDEDAQVILAAIKEAFEKVIPPDLPSMPTELADKHTGSVKLVRAV